VMRTVRFTSGVVLASLVPLLSATATDARTSASARRVITVTAWPTRRALDVHQLTVVVVKPGLAFRVDVRNLTGSTIGNARVTFRLGHSGGRTYGAPIVKTSPLPRLAPNQSRTVTFTLQTPDQIAFAQRTNVRIIVGTRSGRLVRSATYPVIFALG
jgi:hypothetical protein